MIGRQPTTPHRDISMPSSQTKCTHMHIILSIIPTRKWLYIQQINMYVSLMTRNAALSIYVCMCAFISHHFYSHFSHIQACMRCLYVCLYVCRYTEQEFHVYMFIKQIHIWLKPRFTQFKRWTVYASNTIHSCRKTRKTTLLNNKYD